MFLPLAALGLLVVSGLMLDSHRRTWAEAQTNTELVGELQQRQLRAARAQYRRRMQASGLVGVVGGLLLLHPIVPETPLWYVAYASLLSIITAVIFIYGSVDAFANTLRVRKARQHRDDLQTKLEAELRAAQERTSNIE